MKVHLQVKLSTLAHEARSIRQKERHFLDIGRGLKGIFNQSHTPEDIVNRTLPERSKKQKARLAWADNNPEEALTEEQKAYEAFWGLQHHRKNTVRKEARDTHIALGFLRGHDYDKMEAFTYSSPRWDNIERMVLKYSEDDPRDVKQRFEEWVQGAKEIQDARIFCSKIKKRVNDV